MPTFPRVISGGIKISEMPVAPAAGTTDQIEVNQAGTTRSVALGQIAALPASIIGRVTWTKSTKTLAGTSEVLVAANASRAGLIVFNRAGNGQIDLDIAGGTVAANTGRTIFGGNDYWFTGDFCPTGNVTIIGTAGQAVTWWEAV